MLCSRPAVFAESCSSLPLIPRFVWCVKPVYTLNLFVIYGVAIAGGEQAEKKSMIPSAAYLWLQQTL